MTHYDILGVSKNATQDEIRKAYIKLVKQYHPDLYKGDKAYADKKTKEINNAYDVLSNEEERRKYDEEITPKATTYEYTSPKYNDVGPTYNTIYEEILRSYRKKYNDYFDNRNNASNSYGYYQTRKEAERSRKKAEYYSNKKYETINKLYNDWDINASVKIMLIILLVFFISLFILIGSYVQTVKIMKYNDNDRDSRYHAIVSKTDEEIETEKLRTKEEALMIEASLREYYNQLLEEDENLKLENGIYDLVSSDKLRYIYEYYYSTDYTYEQFINYINTNVLVKYEDY